MAMVQLTYTLKLRLEFLVLNQLARPEKERRRTRGKLDNSGGGAVDLEADISGDPWTSWLGARKNTSSDLKEPESTTHGISTPASPRKYSTCSLNLDAQLQLQMQDQQSSSAEELWKQSCMGGSALKNYEKSQGRSERPGGEKGWKSTTTTIAYDPFTATSPNRRSLEMGGICVSEDRKYVSEMLEEEVLERQYPGRF